MEEILFLMILILGKQKKESLTFLFLNYILLTKKIFEILKDFFNLLYIFMFF